MSNDRGGSGITRVWEPVPWSTEDQAMIDSYGKTNGVTSETVDLLKSAGRIVYRRNGNIQSFGNTSIYDPSGKGRDLSAIAAQFETWKGEEQNRQRVNEQYKALAKDRPGRQATILVPMSGPESKTVLGADMSSYGKTVLG